jgi:hypothetical protein
MSTGSDVPRTGEETVAEPEQAARAFGGVVRPGR